MALWFSLFWGNAIVAVTTTVSAHDERRRLIRVEEAAQQALVEAGGVLVDVRSHLPTEHHETSESKSLPAETTMLKSQPAQEDKMKKNLCDENFLQGTPGTNDCVDGGGLILDATMCADAAATMGWARGRPPTYKFEPEDATSQAANPKGCYKGTADTGALFYNNHDGLPANPADGTPICHRPKFKNGTKDTNDGGCTAADLYLKVMDQDECRTYASCKFICSQEEFRVGIQATQNVGNVTSQDDNRPYDHGAEWFFKRPEGCFIHNDDGCVYFNVPRPNEDPTPGLIEGTPICVVQDGHHGNTTAANIAEAAHNASQAQGNSQQQQR